ncbi:DegV family protein [Haloimpatiens lingqiaonensis]|uniref:DegV family protein n=1 Tax=Haloimpatiens lingqiaonensis TaxID=1380675 RepID=UPI0010FF43AB|nr:DegV family protein [Haloimpatiens lingqiaonensis]
MNKIALITDSISDLNKEIVDNYNIKVLPLKIIYKGKEFLDRINITPKDVYDRMPEEVPTTSLPSMDEINNLYIDLEKEDYTHAIAIPVSSNLSGTFNAIKLISDDHPKINTHVFDSKLISIGEGIIVEQCAKLISGGNPFDKIIELLPSIRDKVHLYYLVDTLEYLKKGGRIGKVSGAIGQLLNIKPIISLDEEGTYYTVAKTRGKKQAINKLLSIVQEIVEKCKCKVYVMHGGAEEECKKLFNVVSKFPNITSLYTGEISPAAGVHTGPGLLGIALFEE